MKKIIAFILTAVLFAFAAGAYAAQYGYVKTPTSDGSAYVRRVAGAGQPIVGAGKNGDQLEILKKGNTWHKVRVIRTGVEGYMYGAYVRFTNTAPNTGSWGTSGNENPGSFDKDKNYTPDASRTDKDKVVNSDAKISSSDGYANLRWGAGFEYPVMNTVSSGSTVWALEKNGVWYRCITNAGQIGYIHQNLVKLQSTENGFSGKSGVIRSSDGFANIRSGAGMNHSVRYTMLVGQRTGVYGSSGDWFRVSAGDGWSESYVHKTLVRFVHQAKTTGNVNLRSGPAVSYDKTRVLSRGENVILLATDGKFCRVDTGREIGYMSRNYIQY